jgi:thiol-disulfide isomerase/thioredoxin
MLGNAIQRVKGAFTKKMMLYVVGVIIFICVAVYTYKQYVQPKLNPTYIQNREFEDKKDTKDAELMFFFVNWCPHCKKAKPIWEGLKKKYNGKEINNTTVYFKEINCETNEDMADKYNIEGYPTIKLVKDNEIVEFDAKPSEDTLTQFLHSTL